MNESHILCRRVPRCECLDVCREMARRRGWRLGNLIMNFTLFQTQEIFEISFQQIFILRWASGCHLTQNSNKLQWTVEDRPVWKRVGKHQMPELLITWDRNEAEKCKINKFPPIRERFSGLGRKFICIQPLSRSIVCGTASNPLLAASA